MASESFIGVFVLVQMNWNCVKRSGQWGFLFEEVCRLNNEIGFHVGEWFLNSS